jgi:hypothetical protein
MVKLDVINNVSPQLEKITRQLRELHRVMPSLLDTFKLWILGMTRRARKITIQEVIDGDMCK